MRDKMLMVGLALAVACLWLLFSWEPVAREPVLSRQDSVEQPAATPIAEARPTAEAHTAVPAAPRSQPEPEPEPEPEHEHEHEHEHEPADIPSSFTLVQIEDQPVDMANLPPPRASGPVTELRKQFEGAARDASSAPLEASVQGAFQSPQVPPELLDSVVCQGTVCRVRTRWTPQRAGGFLVAITALATRPQGEGGAALFERNYAIGEAADRNTNGERVIDVYMRRRKPPGAVSP